LSFPSPLAERRAAIYVGGARTTERECMGGGYRSAAAIDRRLF
jgi:hypothetical protein